MDGSNLIVGIIQTLILGLALLISAYVAIRQLRAYVSVSSRESFFYAFNETACPRVRLSMFNVGQTPAYDVRHRMSICSLAHPPSSGSALPELTGNFSAPLVLHPNSSPFFVSHVATKAFTNAQIREIRSGQSRMYVYGEIIYRDTFRITRYTRFCFSVTGTEDMLKKLTSSYEKKDLEVHYEIAPMGNTAT